MCGWHAELAELVRPLVAAMWQDAMVSPYLCTDATGVLVRAKERCRAGRFWRGQRLLRVASGERELHGIEPGGYLRDLFCLLPSWPRAPHLPAGAHVMAT
jgi:hypothetical protein